MSDNLSFDQSVPREACKLITCVLPDHGTEKKLIRALRDEKHITRANSVSCLGLAVLASARTTFGELPQPTLVRKVDVVVTEEAANELYDYICNKAKTGVILNLGQRVYYREADSRYAFYCLWQADTSIGLVDVRLPLFGEEAELSKLAGQHRLDDFEPAASRD